MCFEGCGNTLEFFLNECIEECIKEKILPSDAQAIPYAEPDKMGIHQVTISIQSQQNDFVVEEHLHDILSNKIKKQIPVEFIDNPNETSNKKSKWANWFNILINVIAMSTIIACMLLFPPSILLTVALASLSFLTTAFTSRQYLLAFYRNFKSKHFVNMATTVSLGWFLSLGHTLFHSISMPLASSFSMVFMNFIMPIILIICINGMDEIKRAVQEKSKKIQLHGIRTLFPQMSETYQCYELSEAQSAQIEKINNEITAIVDHVTDEEKNKGTHFIQNLFETIEARDIPRKRLQKGMLIEIKPNECFPTDCILVQGNTVIDASVLTGEPQQKKQLWQSIPSGAINLGPLVTVYAVKKPYNSTVNSLLFVSNRARKTDTPKTTAPKFAYFYAYLVLFGIISAIFAPVAFGVVTIPLVIQNVIGILFSLCPCTIAIGHELPKLLSMHHRNSKGIHLRDDSLTDWDTDEIHTVVFDKTGTLTTGNSVVKSVDGALDSALWQKIYLLEKNYGRAHPLAMAIQKHYETEPHYNKHPLFNHVGDYNPDKNSRGFSGRVQGKTLYIGSHDYLERNAISHLPPLDQSKMNEGLSAVYVAEDGEFKGVIYIEHQVREGVKEALARLKSEGKRIIMLTGDNKLSAQKFNEQINSVFEEGDIHAEQTPQDKALFLSKLMSTPGVKPKGIWFCGDGLNDAPCCRIVSEKGGVSCAMNSNDKSAFFTDISLNGSLDYLFKHGQLNHFLQKNIVQNKGILIHSTLALFAFIISFSIVGIAVSPLIPMAIMLSTTLFVLFNAYRVQLSIDTALDKSTSLPKKLLSSNLSLGLLLGASTLLIISVLLATISTGGLALPIIAFTAGAAAAVSSVCTLSAIGLFGAFILLLTNSLLSQHDTPPAKQLMSHANQPRPDSPAPVLEKRYEPLFVHQPKETREQRPTPTLPVLSLL